MYRTQFIIAFFFLFLGILPVALAQFLPSALSLNITPSSPSPGETILIEAATPTIDRDTVFFDWTIDGVSRKDLSGYGKNAVSLVAGNIGSVIRIGIRAQTRIGVIGNENATIRVSDLSLVWFANTSVQRWYKGKALPVAHSIVYVVATPEIFIDGTLIPPENLIYRWSFDDEIDALTGVGKRVFAIQTKDFPKSSHNVRVVVEDVSKKIRKEKQIFILTTNPVGSIYAVAPLGGIEHRHAVSFFSPPTRSIFDFQFESFFYPIASKRDLSYLWKIGGVLTEGSVQNPYFLTINTQTEQTGEVAVSISVDDLDPLIPPVTRTFTLDLK